MSRPPFFRIHTTQSQHKTDFSASEPRKTRQSQQDTIQEHNTESKTIGRYRRKTQPKNIAKKIAENENRAYNNHIETGRTEKQFLFSPFFALRDTKRYTDKEIHTKEEKTSQRQRKWVNG